MTITMSSLSEDTVVALKKFAKDVKGTIKQASKKMKSKSENSSFKSSKNTNKDSVEIYAIDELAQAGASPILPSTMVMKSPRVVESNEVVQPEFNQGLKGELESKAYRLETELAACSAIMGKLGNTIAPWDIKSHATKVHEAKGQFDRSRANVKDLMMDLISQTNRTMEEIFVIEDRDKLAALTADKEVALQKSFQVHQNHSAQIRAILELIAPHKIAQKENRGAAGGRFAALGTDEMLQMLGESAEAMYYECQELKDNNLFLDKGKTDLAKRVKELSDKLRDEIEIRDREIQNLKSSLKKSTEKANQSAGSIKEEVGSQLAKKTTEIKSLQRRLEVAKDESDQAKAQSKALKASAEQAILCMTQSQEDLKAMSKKLQDARIQKDNLSRELEQTKNEQSTIYNELQEIKNSLPSPKMTFCNKEAGWPRLAFTQRNGKVLHNMGCGGVDISKCVPFQYSGFPELESYIKEEGFVVCRSCQNQPGF